MQDVLIDYESIRKIDFIGDKTVGVCFEDIGFDHVVSDVDTGYHSHKNDGVNDLLYFLAPYGIYKSLFRKMHEFDSQRGGEGDKDRVDHIEVKSSEKISQVTTGDTESRSTEGRHQSGSDGYTGDHISFQTRA